MSDSPPNESSAGVQETPRRKAPPKWGVALFLVLLGGMVVLNQFAATGGPEIEWIEGDLSAALAQVSPERPRVFLYLYEPDDEAHQRNERQVFTQAWAREPLAHTVCCRIDVSEQRLEIVRLRNDYVYKGKPLFLLLSRSGMPVSRTEDAPDKRQFMTYIGIPAQDAYENAQQKLAGEQADGSSGGG